MCRHEWTMHALYKKWCYEQATRRPWLTYSATYERYAYCTSFDDTPWCSTPVYLRQNPHLRGYYLRKRIACATHRVRKKPFVNLLWKIIACIWTSKCSNACTEARRICTTSDTHACRGDISLSKTHLGMRILPRLHIQYMTGHMH